MQIVTRSEAISRGLSHYFTGKACKNGHVASRKTVGYLCVECAKMRSKSRPKQNRCPRIRGKARIDSVDAKRIEAEYGESLRDVLEGFAEQAKFTRLPCSELADLLGIRHQRLWIWFRRYGIKYPYSMTDRGKAAVRRGWHNSPHAKLITANGVTLTQGEWAARLGMKSSTIIQRMQRGWPPALAVTLPSGSQYLPTGLGLKAHKGRKPGSAHPWGRKGTKAA